MISAFTELCPYSLFSTDTHARYHYYISRDKLSLSYAKPMLNCARMDKPNWSRQTYVGMAERKTLSGGGQIILPGQIDLLRQKSLVRQDSLKWDNIYIIIVDLSSATTFIYLGPYLQISATIFILLISESIGMWQETWLFPRSSYFSGKSSNYPGCQDARMP